MATPEQDLAARVAHALLTLTDPRDEIARILGGSAAARAVAELVSTNRTIPTSGRGAAANAQAIENLILKGFYAINATTRIQSADEKESAIRREANYHAQHVAAVDSRGTSAGAVDDAAERYGLVVSWRAVLDEETTPECRAAHGKNFRADTRPAIGWPGTVHGQCFAAGTVVSGPPVDASVARWYEGEVLDVRTVSGRFVTVTPNHPILTSEGWVAAGLLDKGSYLACTFDAQGMARNIDPDDHQVPAFIEDVAGSVGYAFRMPAVGVPTSSEDFHGDGAGSEVSVVRANGFLRRGFDAEFVFEPDLQESFGGRDEELLVLNRTSTFAFGREREGPAPDSVVSGDSVASILSRGASGHHEAVGLLDVPDRHSSFLEAHRDGTTSHPESIRQGFDGFPFGVGFDDLIHRQLDAAEVRAATLRFALKPGLVDSTLERSGAEGGRQPIGADSREMRSLFDTLAGYIEFDRVLHVTRRPFAAHVYNLQTSRGWYIANEIVAHNCRCVAGPPIAGADELG